MKHYSLPLRLCLGIVGLALVGACSSNESDDAATEQDISIFSPEALARLLGTNNALDHLGQFVDPRPEVGTPLMQTFGECCDGVRLAHGNINLEEFKGILERGRMARSENVPILASNPQTGPLFPNEPNSVQCISKFAVYVRGSKGEFLNNWLNRDEFQPIENPDSDLVLGAAATAEFKAALRTAQEKTTVEVIIAPESGVPGFGTGDLDSPRLLRLAFAVVRRPLSNAPGAPVNGFWTMLAAQIDPGRCGF